MTDKPTDLAAIAASVAKALDLLDDCLDPFIGEQPGWSSSTGDFLAANGSNLTDPYWFQRCVLWLLEHHHAVSFDYDSGSYKAQHAFWNEAPAGSYTTESVITCPAEEFPARAIAALVKNND